MLSLSIDKSIIAAKTEVLSVLPLCIAIWLLICQQKFERSIYFLGFGVAIGVAVLCKQPTLIFIFAGLVSAIIRPKKKFQAALLVVSGGALVILIVILIYYVNNGFAEFKWQMWDLPIKYALIDRITLLRRIIRIFTYTEEYSRIFPLLSASVVGAFGIAFTEILRKILSGSSLDLTNRLQLVVSIFATLGFIASLAGSDLYLNYFVMSLPGFVVFSSIFLYEVFKTCSKNLPLFNSIVICNMVSILGTGILAAKEPTKLIMDSNVGKSRELILKLKELTENNERIYVWGYSPDLYVLSNRIPASRYVLSDVLVGFFGEGAKKIDIRERLSLAELGGMSKFLMDVEKKPPKVFVDASLNDLFGMGSFAPDKIPLLNGWLKSNYIFISTYKEGKNEYKVYVKK